ncbi:hypothetical protein [Gilliamella sp. wkB112]|uniref:hypothetical protein n=1 Tax=Gilliamella sp. wkB112 TaxID=3120257 RepID=UPI00080EB984|nr:hypothetical protein [Gilliamella apicola]OCG00764.1 hypothetical protein A9G12_03095 [Gilliamella apicola]
MSIREKYDIIEKDFHKDRNKALKEMIDLYVYAIDSYENDIVDAINLYVCDLGDKEIYNYLEKKMNLVNNEFLRNEFKDWMRIIKSKNNNI